MNTLTIRNATIDDLSQIANIESVCFPEAEAAPLNIIKERLEAYSDGFFVMEKAGEMVGFINGGATNSPTIKDEFFESMEHHDKDGKNLIIFGLDVLPNHQHQGYAKVLMDHFISFASNENKHAVLLTCKDHLIDYYARFGYENNGVSDSIHGGAQWYDMTLNISPE